MNLGWTGAGRSLHLPRLKLVNRFLLLEVPS